MSTADQGAWNLPPPPGFQGLRDDLPLTRYERHLPHWRQDGATYFVTFRLDDALPRAKVEYLKRLRAEWERQHPPPRSTAEWEAILRQTTRLAEGWLDEGMGSCRLREPAAATILERAFHHFDLLPEEGTQTPSPVGWTSGPSSTDVLGNGKASARKPHKVVGPEVQPTKSFPAGDWRYELGGYVIMPNHAHLIVRPLVPETHPLETILQSWKTFAAREINHQRRESGSTFWQQESFDRIIRDEEHLWRAIQYIGHNPARAKLPNEDFRLWLRPSWQRLGWRFVP